MAGHGHRPAAADQDITAHYPCHPCVYTCSASYAVQTPPGNTAPSQEGEVRHTSALVIAKVAAIEIPQNAWPDLVTSLLSNMGAAAGNDGLRQATLECLGCGRMHEQRGVWMSSRPHVHT